MYCCNVICFVYVTVCTNISLNYLFISHACMFFDISSLYSNSVITLPWHILLSHISQSAYLLLSNRISRQGGPVFSSSVGLFHSSGTFFPVLQKSCANRVSIIRAAPTGIFLWVEVSLRRDAAPVISNCTLCSNNNWINWLLVMPEMLYFSYRETILWYMCLISTCKNVILNCCASMCSSAALVTNIVWQNFTIYIKYRIYIRTYKWMIYIKTNMHYFKLNNTAKLPIYIH